MSDSMKAAWDEVGDNFAALARLVRDRYRDAETADARDDQSDPVSRIAPASRPTSSGDDAADSADAASDRPDPAAMFRDALDNLRNAARDLTDRASEITHSDEIRSQARQAGSSLNSAITTTVDALIDDLADLFRTVKDEVSGALRKTGNDSKVKPADWTSAESGSDASANQSTATGSSATADDDLASAD